MQKQHGIILVMVLIFLIILSLFTITILQLSIESNILLNMQNIRDKLFSAAEIELQLAETQIAQHNILLSVPPQLVTDQQFLIDQVPPNVVRHCKNSSMLQQQCYFIELIAKENCKTEMSQQDLPVLFYRLTAKVSVTSLVNQSDILQSTYVVLPSNVNQCRMLNSLTDNEHYIYAGRQSWREITN